MFTPPITTSKSMLAALIRAGREQMGGGISPSRRVNQQRCSGVEIKKEWWKLGKIENVTKHITGNQLLFLISCLTRVF